MVKYIRLYGRLIVSRMLLSVPLCMFEILHNLRTCNNRRIWTGAPELENHIHIELREQGLWLEVYEYQPDQNFPKS